ncbi:hypothetical protein EJ02DRAFT_439446 [Clathrospora elynae]|uniref:Uncharacterized protein n=1 Tax=Clathrospora elynae TaxID=706981 RepID=A0A6A5S384_9PLEO|nr:hypothetical protein EJ02DRAFT_439446 [Clathrospora elynae]
MAPKKASTEPIPKEVTGPKTRVEKAWSFQKYKNGMLNLKAPACFLKITNNNSTQSLLPNVRVSQSMQLPGNKIELIESYEDTLTSFQCLTYLHTRQEGNR